MSVLTLTKQAPQLDLRDCIRAVEKTFGKKALSQVSEIVSLAMGDGKITPQEYYYYRLYDDDLDLAAKKAFVGFRTEVRFRKLTCPRDWWAVAQDKIILGLVLQSLGIPTPRNLALYHPTRLFDAPTIKSKSALAKYLREDATYPFFSKPVDQAYSVGVASADRLDDDTLCMADGQAVRVEEFVDAVEPFREGGYLFQKRLSPHPEIEKICGDRISAVRAVVMVRDGEPALYRAAWKIAAGTSIADNFWRDGNLLAAVDLETGATTRVVRGFGPAQMEVETHPDTGEKVKGVTLPHWSELKRLCLRAAAALPSLRLQAWDVALCPGGPVFLEVDALGGDYALPQVSARRGMMTEEFRAFIESCKPKRRK